MTDEQLINILKKKNLTDGLEILGTLEDGLSAMKEAIQKGIDEYVVTQKGHVFNIWEIEQRKKVLEAMRIESIGFAEWRDKLSVTKRCTVHPPAGSGCGTGLYEKTTDQLYNEYKSKK